MPDVALSPLPMSLIRSLLVKSAWLSQRPCDRSSPWAKRSPKSVPALFACVRRLRSAAKVLIDAGRSHSKFFRAITRVRVHRSRSATGNKCPIGSGDALLFTSALLRAGGRGAPERRLRGSARCRGPRLSQPGADGILKNPRHDAIVIFGIRLSEASPAQLRDIEA